MKKIKLTILDLWFIEGHIRTHITVSRWLHFQVPIIGKVMSMLMDRIILTLYGIDLLSASVDVAALSISHPNGVLLGGNGIVSPGRVAVMAGVKFVGQSPSNKNYMRKHSERRVFELGDNIVIGANSVVIGPVRICDNVIIGAMSLVNKDINEAGVYVGSPVRKISDIVVDEWFNHL